MLKKLALILSLILLLVIMVIPTAQAAFLCPVVGDGVLVADSHGGVSSISPPVGTSLLPGNNQAGANANSNAYNTDGPGNPNAGPGHNPDFSPIWP